MQMTYRYPTDERTTDEQEVRQDAHKRLREASMIQAMMSFHWRNAMDFGCGLGRNFGLFANARTYGAVSRLYAIEADHSRLDLARQKGAHYACEKFEIVYDSALNLLEPATLDLILCCQVMSHMPTDATKQILNEFTLLLARGGIIIICVPFHLGLARGEFLHAIDFNRRDDDEVVREPMTRPAFNRMAQNPPDGVLPVRAFSTRLLTRIASNADLPSGCAAPRLFARYPGLRCSGCFVYSIHQFRSGLPMVGDLIVKLVKDH